MTAAHEESHPIHETQQPMFQISAISRISQLEYQIKHGMRHDLQFLI